MSKPSTAFCPICRKDVIPKWKPGWKYSDGFKAWFKCPKCGCDKLEFKNMPE
jgi:hypothetical protein